MEEKVICSVCGETIAREDSFWVDCEYYCEDCYNELTVVCDHCGATIPHGEARIDSEHTLCMECYYEHYSCCEECGRTINNDDCYYLDDYDEYPYCYNCYQRNLSRKNIHNYSYKPEPIFHGDGNRFFGIELEVDYGGNIGDNAEKILDIANDDDEDRLYIKNDSSIEDGFEMVSHPMTLDYHKKDMPWEDIMKNLINMGYMSHKTATCGLHCHINRTAFGETQEEQEEAIARILYFVEHHWDEMLRFSRRTEVQMARWANRYGTALGISPKKMMDDIKKCDYSRYRCVNIQNYYTIEFRMFRGTLKYNTFIATLQLINEICNVAISLSDEEMTELSWNDFIKGIDKDENSELFTYLKERNLYEEV